MQVNIERTYHYDGNLIAIGCFDAGSAKEAMAMIEQAAEDLGAVSPNPSAKPKGKGGRPKTTILPPGAAPALPVAPPTVQQAFEPPSSAPPLHSPGPVASLSPAPPMPPPPSTVGFAPSMAPPPAAPMPPSPEFMARKQVQQEYDALLQSVPGEWQASVRQNADDLCVQASGGAPIGELTVSQAEATLVALRGYRATCDAAPR